MKILLLSIVVLFTFSCGTTEKMTDVIGLKDKEPDATPALKEALRKGSEKAIAQLSSHGAYYENSIYRITIPDKLEDLSTKLRQYGFGVQVDQFERKMSNAAELAAQQAAPLFLTAINNVTFENADEILMGEDNALTEYFHKALISDLKKKYMLIVDAKMKEVELRKQYRSLVKKYNNLPKAKSLHFSLKAHVTNHALKGLFHIIENTEREIRFSPAARTSELLQQVFARQDGALAKSGKKSY